MASPARAIAATKAMASSGYGNYGYGAGADLSFNCEVRYDGRIRDIDIKRRTANWRGY